ncbi:MAG: lytic transglycosylase domain-containing protein [Maritimibacter sp.]
MREIVVVMAAALAALAVSARAEEPMPGTDFTFHRVTAPPKGATPRITVQIDPEEQAAWISAAPETETIIITEEAPGATGPGVWDWFWTDVSDRISDAGPANTANALDALARAEDLPGPSLQALLDISNTYGTDILASSVGTDVSPALVLALIWVESSGRAGAQSSAGAQGLMQLIPATAERFGVEDASDPKQNIKGGVAYLAWLLDHFDRDPILALAGYNAGENAVTENGGVPPFAETRAYVPKVLNAWRVAKGLCLTPPELITDGCVFAGLG